MGITSTATHRLLMLSRSGLILNRGLNACMIPAFIVSSRSVASAAAAKKPITRTAAAVTPKTSSKTSAGGTKVTAAKTAAKTGSTAKKPATPKTAAKKPVKKAAEKQELTEEQKRRHLVKQLRVKALKPPPRSSTGGYAFWFGEQMKKGKKKPVQLAAEWNTLPQDVKDTYVKKGAEEGAGRPAEFAKWVMNISPFVIRQANTARRHLKDLGISSNTTQIPDDRLPKRVTRPVLMYSREQFLSGRSFPDATGKNSIVVANKVMSEEYEKLPESEKNRFENMVKQNKEDYDAEIAKLEKQWGN